MPHGRSAVQPNRANPSRVALIGVAIAAGVPMLAGCHTRPDFDLDPKHPLDRAITQRHGGENEVTRLVRRDLKRLAGPGASLVQFERVLTSLGADCNRHAKALRCIYLKRQRHERFHDVEFFELDILISSERLQTQRIVVCFGRRFVQSEKDDWSDMPAWVAPAQKYCGPSRYEPQ